MEIIILSILFLILFAAIASAKNKNGSGATTKIEVRGVQKTEKQYIREAELLLKKHNDLLQKCMGILERKVSVVDDYGEENWGALPEEINRLVCKIAEREGLIVKDGTIISRRLASSPTDEELHTETLYGTMGNIAAIRFKKHHEENASVSSEAKLAVHSMSGVEFETHIVKILREKGYEDIAGTPTTGDQGADILAKKDGRTIVIQAKRYAKPVGNKAVQEVTAALRFYGGDEAWVVTNALFTPSARALAHRNNVRLIDGTALASQEF